MQISYFRLHVRENPSGRSQSYIPTYGERRFTCETETSNGKTYRRTACVTALKPKQATTNKRGTNKRRTIHSSSANLSVLVRSFPVLGYVDSAVTFPPFKWGGQVPASEDDDDDGGALILVRKRYTQTICYLLARRQNNRAFARTLSLRAQCCFGIGRACEFPQNEFAS